MGFADFLRQIAQGTPQGGQSQPVGGFAAPLVQRLAQQAVGQFSDTLPNPLAARGIGPAQVHYDPLANVPVLGGLINTTVNGPLGALGLAGEATGNLAKTLAGELALGAAAGQVAAGDPNSTATAGSRAVLAQGPLHPGRAIEAARTSPDSGMAWLAGALELASNPLNYAGGIGAAGTGLEAAARTPEAAPALDAALTGLPRALAGFAAEHPGIAGGLGGGLADTGRALEGLNQAYGLPFKALGAPGKLLAALRGKATPVETATEAGQQFARQNAGNTALGAVRGNTPLADLLADVGADGKEGLGPALPPELGPALPPELGPPAGGRGNVPTPDLLPGLGINGRPGLGPELPPLAGVPLPPEAGPAFPEQGNVSKDQLLPGIGRNGGRGIGPLLPASQDLPVPPAAPAVQSLADLLGAARTTAQPTPLERLAGAAQATAAREVAPRQTLAQIEAAIPKLPASPEVGQLPPPETGAASTPVTPEPPALDFTDRAGVVKAVANAPLDHLNNVLRDLHNAVYPGQQSDFAIPALTGQAKQAFRTSFLTDHPGGNAAEPYLDYLISRVQKDPKAAARLADLNPLLADDVNLLAESDLPLAEHKRLVQSLFGAGPFAGAETPPTDLPALSGQPGAQAGTLDDLRALITGGDGGKMGGYAPNDPAFYAKRLGVDPAQVPGMLDQLVQEGTLGRLPDGSLGIKPAPMEDANALRPSGLPTPSPVSAPSTAAAPGDLAPGVTRLTPPGSSRYDFLDAPRTGPLSPPAPDTGIGSIYSKPAVGARVYRGITQDEANSIVGGGTIQSRGDFSLAGEGTNFANDFATAEDYVNVGRDAPAVTGRPTFVIEAKSDPGMRIDRDGYVKTPGAVPTDRITRVWRFNPDGSVDAATALDPLVQRTPAGMTPAERADWQAKYVGQSQAGTDILAAGDKVGGSDLTQADLNALSPQDRMAALRKLAGGFADAAGGGGFGLLPGGYRPPRGGALAGGLPAGNPMARIGSTLGGATVGGLVGGGLGFAAGAPDTPLDERLHRGALGLATGAVLGGNLGSTDQGSALLAEARAGNAAAWQAGDRTIIPTSIGKGVSSLRATSKTALMTIPRNIMDNTLKQWMGGNNPLRYLGDLLAQSREWGTVLPALRQAGDEQQRMHVLLTSLGPDFANRDPESMARLAVKQGMDYNLDPTDLGTAGAYPPVSAARGAVAALAQPVKLAATGYLTPAVGALEGLTLAGRAALQNAVLTPADMIGRLAFSMPVYTRELAAAAPAFIRKVAASGQSTALLDQEGRFGASLIKDPALRGEWEAIQNAAEDAGAQRALDYMGDFGTHSAARKITNNAAPGGVWNIGQSQLLARRAAEHPALAVGTIQAAYQNYQSALAAGHPEEAGTATIDDRTPGVGLLARLANGGAPGTLAIPLTYSGSPIGPESFDLPRQLDPFLHPNQQLYDKIKTIVDTAGLGVNPALDMAAYRLGISDTPHGSASRWAPVGTYAEQMAHAAGIPILGDLAENPVADLLDPAAKPGDVQQQLRTGRYLNPAAITAGNEMVYERRGTSASDPKNVDLVAQLRDPSSAFYQEALARGLGAKAGGALLGEVIPGHPEATTATARAEEAAKLAFLNQGFPLTSAQVKAIAAAPNGGQILSQLRQAQIDQAKLDNPALAVQDLATPQALGQKVYEQWQRDNAGLALFPSVYGVQGAQEQERLGLVPLGTAAAAQQHLDQLLSGQAYGRPELYPGVAPMPYDPTPILDLMRYLNGGR